LCGEAHFAAKNEFTNHSVYGQRRNGTNMEELKAYLKELISEIMNVGVLTSKVNEHDVKLSNQNDRIMFLELSDARREERDKTIIEKLNKIQNVTEELASKPTKKWDLITAIAISSAVSGIIGFFLSHLFK
jgi:predicted nuclease with TOPRIM domain